MKRIFHILLFVGAFLFYWNTAHFIENRTEAAEAYEYAMMVETQAWAPQKERPPALKCRTEEQGISVHSEPHPWLYHPHHLLYGSLMKAGYSGVKSLGWNIRAFDFLMLMSSLSAAGTLFLFFQLLVRKYSRSSG